MYIEKVSDIKPFDNRIDLPLHLKKALLERCTLINQIYVLEFDSGSDGKPMFEPISVFVYAVPPMFSDIPGSGEGVIVTDDWACRIWYLESTLDLPGVLADYEKMLREGLTSRGYDIREIEQGQEVA